MRALLFLDFYKLINYLRITLRSPKRLIPTIILGLWFTQVIFMQSFRQMRSPMTYPSMIGLVAVEEIQPFIFIVLSLIMVYLLIRSFSESLLIFHVSDIDFLFGSPINRRLVMLYKLTKVYAKMGLYVLFFLAILMPNLMIISRSIRPDLLFLPYVAMILFGIFIVNICSTINIITNIKEGGRWWLSWLIKGTAYVLLIFGTVSIALVYRQTGDFLESIKHTFMSPVFLIILFPAKYTADLALTTISGWQPVLEIELWAMVLLTGLSLFLILSRKENPYEPSLSISAKIAERRAAIRAGDPWKVWRDSMQSRKKSRGIKTPLVPFGSGAWAIVWKNLNTMLRQWGSIYIFIFVAITAGLIALKMFVVRELNDEILIFVGPVSAFYLLFITASVTLNHFRADLKQANILKPMPIPPWKLVAISALQGPLIITVFIWVVLGITSALFSIPYNNPTVLAALVLPFVSYALACSQSTVAVLYPNWDDQSQQFVGFLLGSLAAFIAVVPTVVAGVILWIIGAGVIGSAIGIALVSMAMAAAGIALGAYAYHRHDPTNE